MNIPLTRWLGIYGFMFVVTIAKNLEAQGFEDVAEKAGLSYLQVNRDFHPAGIFPYHLLSGGVAAGDYDKDGWTDLFVTRMADPDILFRNTGTEAGGVIQFENVSEQAGFTDSTTTNGALWIDIDNDHDLDLYVSTMYEQRYLLYINQGDGSFRENAQTRGAALRSPQDHNGFSLAAGDYDKDGWTDIHTTEWLIDQTKPESIHHNVLLRNLGPNAPGFFRNETVKTGTILKGRDEGGGQFIAYGFTSNFADMDGDGWQDLLVVSDYKSSQIFWNNADGTFTDGTSTAGIQLEWAGMGSSIVDYNGDGLLDWFVASQSDNALYQNNGDRTFTSTAVEKGVGKSDWSWGTSWIDFDNDGDQDLIVTNGLESHDRHYQISSEIDFTYFWEYEEGHFTNVAEQLGITDEEAGKGLVTFDFDNDGDLDVFIVNNEGYPILYRNNTSNENHWLRVHLEGRISNPAGYGAKLYLRRDAESNPVYQEVIGGSNFLGQNDATCHFGLGPETETVHSLEIHWPSGINQTLENIKTGRKLYVLEPTDKDHWLRSNFSEADLSDPDITSMNADPDVDNMSNLFEYAFGQDPNEKTHTGGKIRYETQPTLAGSICFSYERKSGTSDLHYRYESSSDLEIWTEVPAETINQEMVAMQLDGREKIVVTIQNLDPHKQFIRVRAHLLEPEE